MLFKKTILATVIFRGVWRGWILGDRNLSASIRAADLLFVGFLRGGGGSKGGNLKDSGREDWGTLGNLPGRLGEKNHPLLRILSLDAIFGGSWPNWPNHSTSWGRWLDHLVAGDLFVAIDAANFWPPGTFLHHEAPYSLEKNQVFTYQLGWKNLDLLQKREFGKNLNILEV